MTSKPVGKVFSATLGDLLAMSKLVQMVTHQHEFDGVNLTLWKEYLRTSLGLTEEEVEVLVTKARRMSNRILDHAETV